MKTVDFSYFNNPSSKSEELLSFSSVMIVNYRPEDSTFELVQPDSENHVILSLIRLTPSGRN